MATLQVTDIPAGSVGSPALTHTGDLDTGLYFPAGTNEVALSAGGTKVIHGTTTSITSSIIPAVAANTFAVRDANSRLQAADPSAATDLVTLGYLNAFTAGVRDPKDAVRVATTAAGTLATSFENGDTIDGVVLATGDRILIKDQSAGAENGIYTVNASGAPTRATDADTSAEVTAGMFMWVNEGTTNADSGWLLTTNDPITLGSTALVFTQVSGLGQITAGNGLTKTGNTLDVSVDNATVEISSDQVRVKDNGITDAKLRQSAALSVIGRSANTTGNVADISGVANNQVLRIASSTLGFGQIDSSYVSDFSTAAQGASQYKQPVRVATVANITLAGSAPNTLDGVTLAANDRILVKDQSTDTQNGLYFVSTLGTGSNGTWTRSTDADTSAEVLGGLHVFVNEGNANANSEWILQTNDPITLGSTSLTFNRPGIVGGNNTALGLSALKFTTGARNTGLGQSAGLAVTSGTDITAVGYLAGSTMATGTNLTAVGSSAATAATGSDITAVGKDALLTGSSGSRNTAIGSTALDAISTNSDCTAVGADALGLATGGTNTAIGSTAGNTITTGTANTFLGYNADSSTSGGVNRTAVGANATVTADNSIQLGDGSTTLINTSAALNIGGAVTHPDTTHFFINLSGLTTTGIKWDTTANQIQFQDAGTTRTYIDLDNGEFSTTSIIETSDERLKHDITNIESAKALKQVRRMQGVYFTRNDTEEREVGVIAQRIAALEPLLVQVDDKTGYMSVNYTRLTALLIEAVKEQQNQIDSLRRQVDALKNGDKSATL